MPLKMVTLLLFHLVVVFVGRTSSGVVPQNFKSLHKEPSHLEEIFTNNGANTSNSIVDNSELHNESSSVLVGVENQKASHVAITDLHNISDSDKVENTIPEETSVVKNISTGSTRSKKKVSKESKKKRKSVNKTFREESDHGDANNVKATAAIEGHSDDIRHNNVSMRFDHVDHVTNSHFDNISDYSEDVTLKPDHLDNVSKSFDQDVNLVNTEFNTSLISNRNHSEEVDLNHFHPDQLNDSVVILMNEATDNISKEINDTLKIALELNNHTSTTSDPPKTFEEQTDHFGHMENSHNTSIQLNQTALSLSNSSKLFLNIHNSFMRLNRTDKTDAELLNNIDATSSKTASNVHDRFDTTEIDEESFEKTSKTEISSDGSNSPENETNLAPNITMKINFTNILLSDTKDNGVGHKADELGHKEDGVGHDEGGVGHGEGGVGHDEGGVGHDEGGVGHKADELGHKEGGVGHDEGGVGHDEGGVGHDENGVGHDEGRVGHKDNESGHETNSDILDTVARNEDDVNVTSEIPGELGEININKPDFINSETKESIIVSETNETQGLFSSLGLDFLMNSELAKNAASAMEVFNFSDSALTDHIVDDKNDMHHFLDLIPLEHSDNRSKSEQTPSTSSKIDEEVSTFDAESSTFDSDSTTLDAENSTLVTERSSSFENDSFKVLTTTSSPPILNSTVEFEVTTLPSQIILNSTVEYEATTIPAQLLLNSTIEYDETTTISPPMFRNGTEITNDTAKCPPPGFCIFWFLGQDTCTVNSHCLGSRICCQIGCTKTCIEV